MQKSFNKILKVKKRRKCDTDKTFVNVNFTKMLPRPHLKSEMQTITIFLKRKKCDIDKTF